MGNATRASGLGQPFDIMTALNKYQRLEGIGLWRADAGAQRREVAVRLGEASLTIVDMRSDMVLSHWALPALVRQNPGRMPAIYQPSDDPEGESLETDDTVLTEALETLRLALTNPPRTRWLKRGSVVLVGALVLTAMAYMPKVIASRTAGIVPQAMRTQIGRDAFEDLIKPGSGLRHCAQPSARQTLAALRSRILGGSWRVAVIDGIESFEAGQLPGRLIVLGRGLIERLDSPEALAGWLIAAEQQAEANDPLLGALSYSGLSAMLTLLTTGALPEGSLEGYARAHLVQPMPWPDAGPMGARFTALGLPARAYADSLPADAARLSAVLSTDLTEAPPLMSDGEWLTLQAICLE